MSKGLVVAAICLGLGFLVRYEAVAFAGAGVIALIVRVWSNPLQQDHLEAIPTSFVAPISYRIGLWILWNTPFAGDPLYFLTGSGSNTFYTAPIRAGADPVLLRCMATWWVPSPGARGGSLACSRCSSPC